MFPGFDKDERWLFLEDLWLNSNLQFSGFYLKGNQWPQHWWDQRDTGWGLWPIWVPYNDQQILGKSPNLFSTYIGTMHGNQAFQMARDQKIEAGATIYLDLEAPLVSDEQFSQGRDYVEAWMTAIQNNDYAPGIYCSPVDVNTFLTDPRFQQFKVVLFPFAIAGPSTQHSRARVEWQLTPTSGHLMPLLSNQWPVGRAGWGSDMRVIGCQHDQWHPGTTVGSTHNTYVEGLRWRNINRGDIDWDSSRVPDPAHALASVALVASKDRMNDNATAFLINSNQTYLVQRNGSPWGDTMTPRLGIDDTGPRASTPEELAEHGFDTTNAAAVSRNTGFIDLFMVAQNGTIRTIWKSPTVFFPVHPWVINPPKQLARKGSPIAAASRDLNQIDIFYVNRNHELISQWWHPTRLNWPANITIASTSLVAPSSNLVVLPALTDATILNQLDVFFISFVRPTNPTASGSIINSYALQHASWSQTGFHWNTQTIPITTSLAAASGVAAVRTLDGHLHVVVQSRDRSRLCIYNWEEGRNWTPSTPKNTPPTRNSTGVGPLVWWMTFKLIAFVNDILLVGVRNDCALAWCGYGPAWGNTWGEFGLLQLPRESGRVPRPYSTGRPIQLVRFQERMVDVIGVSPNGYPVVTRLQCDPNGIVTVASPPNTIQWG